MPLCRLRRRGGSIDQETRHRENVFVGGRGRGAAAVSARLVCSLKRRFDDAQRLSGAGAEKWFRFMWADQVLDAPVDTGQARTRQRSCALAHALPSITLPRRSLLAQAGAQRARGARLFSTHAEFLCRSTPRPSTARSCLLEIIASHPPSTPHPRSCSFRPASWPFCFSKR